MCFTACILTSELSTKLKAKPVRNQHDLRASNVIAQDVTLILINNDHYLVKQLFNWVLNQGSNAY